MKDHMNECCELCAGLLPRTPGLLGNPCLICSCHSNSTHNRCCYSEQLGYTLHHCVPQHTSPEKGGFAIDEKWVCNSSFTEKTLDLFREKFVRDDGLMDKYYEYGGGEPGDHTAFMADAIEKFFEDKLEESAENERTRILTLIESKKKKVSSEEILKLRFLDLLCTRPSREQLEESIEIFRARTHNAALTALAAELQDR